MTYALLPAEKIATACDIALSRLAKEKDSGVIFDGALFQRVESLKSFAQAALGASANSGALRISFEDFVLIQNGYTA